MTVYIMVSNSGKVTLHEANYQHCVTHTCVEATFLQSVQSCGPAASERVAALTAYER